MLNKEQISKRISELSPSMWYKLEDLIHQGFVEDGFNYKKYFLYRRDEVLGASIIHFLKGLYGIDFTNKDYLDCFSLAKLLNNPEVFSYLKQNSFLPTVMYHGTTKIELLHIGKVKALQHLLTPATSTEKEAIALLPEVPVTLDQMAIIINNPEKTLAELSRETGLPSVHVEILQYERGVKEGLTMSEARVLREKTSELKKDKQRGVSAEESRTEYTISEVMKLTEQSYEAIAKAIHSGILKIRIGFVSEPNRIRAPIYLIEADSIQNLSGKNGNLKKTRREFAILQKNREQSLEEESNFLKRSEVNKSPFHCSHYSLLERDIKKNPLLRYEEEGELLLRIEQGDPLAINDLVEAHIPFVIRVARDEFKAAEVYFKCQLSDLIDEGVIGLMGAATKWNREKAINPKTGERYAFQTYAVWCIRGAIRHFMRHLSILSGTSAAYQYITPVLRAINYLTNNFDRHPTIDEIATQAKVSKATVKAVLKRNQRVLSLDANITENDERTLHEKISDEQAEKEVTVHILYEDTKRSVANILTELTTQEAQILKMYYGFPPYKEPICLEGIGKKLGLTRERIRQIRNKAIERLNHPSRRGRLEELLLEL